MGLISACGTKSAFSLANWTVSALFRGAKLDPPKIGLYFIDRNYPLLWVNRSFLLTVYSRFQDCTLIKNLHYSQVMDRGVQFRKQLIHFLSRMTYAMGQFFIFCKHPKNYKMWFAMGKTQPLKVFLNQEILVILFALFTHNFLHYLLTTLMFYLHHLFQDYLTGVSAN